jgi:putative PIG3 family NAD(P)H quinone oxidoreductase
MTLKMKAVVMDEFGSADVLHLGMVERPEPNDTQVLIQVEATSVNRPDIVQREGNYPPSPGESDVLGLEIAGTVIELGKDVTDWNLGDRVMSLVGGGGYAQFAIAYAAHLIRIPESMSFQDAACICETYITAYLNLFRIASLRNGQSVLLHGGGGGVNTAAAHLCHALVPEAVVIVTTSSRKVELVRALGVDSVIDYQKQDFTEEVKRITQGRGVDVILDHIGAAYLTSNMKALAIKGTLVIIGVMSGARTELNLAAMMVKCQCVVGSVLRRRSISEKAEIVADFTRTVMPFMTSREIIPSIYQVLPLEEVAVAHKIMEANAHFGKIVLQVDSS